MDETSFHNLERAGLVPVSMVLGKAPEPDFVAPDPGVHNFHTRLADLRGRVTTATEGIVQTVANKKVERFLVLALLVLALLAHGLNMFQYPYYENDEGTYISQAWSVVTEGSLSPYTFWYDHAPAGWFFIGIFAKLTGGFFTFGSSVDGGRVFMMLLHAFSTLFIYYIAKRLSGGKIVPGILAGLIFSLSPLAIYFQRRVLLDNIMVFWVLASLAVLLVPKLKLRGAILSALLFGIAVLTKETAIFFLPAFAYAVWIQLHTKHRTFGVVLWATISASVVSLYPIYALLKSEFFPDTWFGGSPHVSLLETLSMQAGRGDSFYFWQAQSDFYKNAVEWFSRDPILTVGGATAVIISLFAFYKLRALRIPLLASLGMLFFLMRGGLVINFYLLPLIPFVALLMGALLDALASAVAWIFVQIKWAQNTRIMYAGSALVASWAIAMSLLLNPSGLFTVNETEPMKQAIEWVKANLNSNDTLVIDNAIFVDVRESRFEGDVEFANAEWFWKVEKDDAVYKKNLGSDWLNVDYVVLSHEMIRQAGDYQIDRIKEILPNSTLITGWSNGGAHIDLPKYISTNGDWMRIYKVAHKDQFALKTLWDADKALSVESYGQVVDEAGNTTASLQGEAMLRAVIAGDKEGFNGLWSWTRDHLQHRSDLLISEQWGSVKGVAQVTDTEATLKANQDIALALILAGRTWNSADFENAGRSIAYDIWQKMAVTATGKTMLATSTQRNVRASAVVNSSLYAPAHYRVFAQVDESHAWNVVANEAYAGFPTINTAVILQTVNKQGRVIDKKEQPVDTAKLTWNIALDGQWFKNVEAKDYLQKNLSIVEILARREEWNEYDAALLNSLSIVDPAKTTTLYGQLPSSFFNRSTMNWQEQRPLAVNTNLWLSLALYQNENAISAVAKQQSAKKVTAR